MASKKMQFACKTSIVLFCISLFVFLLSFALNPWDYRISLSDDLHVGLWRGRVVFFNDAEYGPYRGSIIGIAGSDGNIYPPLEREILWGDTAGVYFRYFRWSDSTLWTLMVSCLWPVSLFLLLPAIYGLFRWPNFMKSSDPFQFGIRRLILLTTAVAIIFALSIRIDAPRYVQAGVAACMLFFAGWIIMRGPRLVSKFLQLRKRSHQIAQQRVTLETDALKEKQDLCENGAATESERR